MSAPTNKNPAIHHEIVASFLTTVTEPYSRYSIIADLTPRKRFISQDKNLVGYDHSENLIMLDPG